jgi:hypothetical protein
MVLGLVVDFWGLIFPARWSGVFAGGFREKPCAERGFLLVSLWWVAGRSWCVGWRFSGAKNVPLF